LTAEEYMEKAILEAKKAKKKSEVPIGAIIVKDNKILSKAHNLRETKQNSLYHAEIIAIYRACKKTKNFRLEDCEMYVTLEPCLMCAGAIIQSRIKKIYIGTADEKYGAVFSKLKAFNLASNHKVNYEKGILEQESKKIIKEFFKEIRRKHKGS